MRHSILLRARSAARLACYNKGLDRINDLMNPEDDFLDRFSAAGGISHGQRLYLRREYDPQGKAGRACARCSECRKSRPPGLKFKVIQGNSSQMGAFNRFFVVFSG